MCTAYGLIQLFALSSPPSVGVGLLKLLAVFQLKISTVVSLALIHLYSVHSRKVLPYCPLGHNFHSKRRGFRRAIVGIANAGVCLAHNPLALESATPDASIQSSLSGRHLHASSHPATLARPSHRPPQLDSLRAGPRIASALLIMICLFFSRWHTQRHSFLS